MVDYAQVFKSAADCFNSGKLAEAETLCDQILGVLPKNHPTLHLKGVVRARRGEPIVGADFIRRAVELDRSRADYHYSLGQTMLQLGNRIEAIAALRSAVELVPHDGPTLVDLGLQLTFNLEFDAAIDVLQRAIEADRAPTEAFTWLGCHLQYRGRTAEAERLFRRALGMPPDRFCPAAHYLDALEKGLFFGFSNGGLQANPARQVFMSATVHLQRGRGRALQILEIGSYMGASALTWAAAVERLYDGPARLLCVDTWRYSSTEAPNDWMLLGVKSGIAYEAFRRNTATASKSTTIEHMRGASADIMPTLERGSFDIVYIDGSHAYDDVLADIKAAIPLVREGGLLCGDDLEVQLHEGPPAEVLRRYTKVDGVTDTTTGRYLHPGVTLAVAESFGPVSGYDGFWIVRKSGNGFEPVVLRDADASLPMHWPSSVTDELRRRFSGSGEVRSVIG